MKILIVVVSYIAAFICGMYAQSLAYFLEDYVAFEAFTILIVFTILCFLLYIFSISYYWFVCQKAYFFKNHSLIIALLIIFALPVMWFSFIVCMFWWG